MFPSELCIALIAIKRRPLYWQFSEVSIVIVVEIDVFVNICFVLLELFKGRTTKDSSWTIWEGTGKCAFVLRDMIITKLLCQETVLEAGTIETRTLENILSIYLAECVFINRSCCHFLERQLYLFDDTTQIKDFIVTRELARLFFRNCVFVEVASSD